MLKFLRCFFKGFWSVLGNLQCFVKFTPAITCCWTAEVLPESSCRILYSQVSFSLGASTLVAQLNKREMWYLTNFFRYPPERAPKIMTKSPKPHLDTISRSPLNRDQSWEWRHRMRWFCRILQILRRLRLLWIRFQSDRLILSGCGFGLFFVIF